MRGGLFQSKEGGKGDHASAGHKAVRRDWRRAKIALTNTVELFEDLLNDISVPDQDLAKLREALNVWDEKKVLLGRVPGLRYVDGAEEGEPTELEKEGARLLMVWLRMVIEKEMKEEWRDEGISAISATVLNEPQQVLTIPESTGLDPLVEAMRSQPPESQWISAPEPASEESSDAHTTAIAMTATPLASQLNFAIPGSILKRPRTRTIPGSQPTSPSPKRVRTTDSVTISPEHLYVVNPSPFQPLSRTAVVLPHADHTLADYHRPRPKFHRTTPAYTPGVWASEAFSKKVDTSFRGISREDMEKHYDDESAEQEQEQMLADKLKETSRGWVALWWANKIAPHLDLEKLKMEMLARSGETEVR
ncbi:hypothetical protein J4E93_004504 [Alternaria ventricosa]|uniref:uncharacterized protein n=1 Tax=Alternaria ventricosa TaxID=1187951 RepID=UPI0020C4F7C4|nr:uncharacterized protein J4E93_004504 [Alternaria ventricosa]KAI4648093.1 hypothetical protein J4E93_004504 [Alternaria ventricosa]